MNEFRPDRRGFLALAGAGLAGAVAGCSEPRAENATNATDEASAQTIDRGNVADGSTYTDVYEAVIDSVTKVHAVGVTDPFTGEEGRGQGSGFLFTEDHVVTNEHVVADANAVDLQYSNGDWTETDLVGTDAYSDLAVLEADHVPDGATPLPLAGERPVVGQEVLAVGNPFGLEGSMSKGIVSGVDRTFESMTRDFAFSNAIQTDAAVNPGNSGGPLVNLDGEVIGVVNATAGDNVGFAVSAAIANRVVPELIDTGEYDHPYLGIGLATVDRYIAEANDLPETTGVIVTEVIDGEAADGVLEPARLRRRDRVYVDGDVIFAIDGKPIPDRHTLSTYLGLETEPGQTIGIDLWRDGTEITETVTLGTRPSLE